MNIFINMELQCNFVQKLNKMQELIDESWEKFVLTLEIKLLWLFWKIKLFYSFLGVCGEYSDKLGFYWKIFCYFSYFFVGGRGVSKGYFDSWVGRINFYLIRSSEIQLFMHVLILNSELNATIRTSIWTFATKLGKFYQYKVMNGSYEWIILSSKLWMVLCIHGFWEL